MDEKDKIYENLSKRCNDRNKIYEKIKKDAKKRIKYGRHQITLPKRIEALTTRPKRPKGRFGEKR